MPRPERPLDTLDSPVAQLAAGLRELREKAGKPGYRQMAGRVNYSVATLSAAASGRRLPTLEVTLAYVAACDGDLGEWERRWREAERLSVAPADDPAAEPDGHGRPPYPGLATFQPEDTEMFFGRTVLVDELVGRLGQRRFLAVFGPSGVGKSSLVRAGLIPAVGGRAVVLTPGAHPMTELAVHLARHAAVPAGGLLAELREDPARASLMVRQGLPDVPPGDDLLVVVDQFEEVFATCADPAERADFVAALLAMCREPDGRARVVLAVRADHYARFAEHPALLAALTDAQVLIGGMNPAELREAVTKPAEARGARVEGALAATIVAEVSDAPGALPLAAHALREAWHRRQGAMVTLAGYQAAGGVAGAVAHTAEQAYERLSEQERLVARRVLMRMVDVGPDGLITRRRLTRTELDTIEAAPAVVEAFAAARLVSTDRDLVEIAHEALIRAWPRLRDWVEESRAGLRLHRQLTDATAAWEALGRDRGALYRGLRLSSTVEAADAKIIDLTSTEQEFLQTSQQNQLARARRARRTNTVLAGLLAVVLAVASAAVWQWRTAITAQQMALSRQLAAQSATQLAVNPDLAGLLAVHAHRISPTNEATASLYAAAAQPTVRHLTGHTGLLTAVAYSPDGHHLASAGAGAGEPVRVWDLDTGKSRTLTGHTDGVSGVAYSPDGHHLAGAGYDRTVRIWDLDTGESRELIGHNDAVTAVAFSPDGHHLASASDDRTVRIWDLDTGKSRELIGHTGLVTAVAYSPDGHHLASAGYDNAVRVWDLDTGKSRQLTGHIGAVVAVAYSPDGHHLASAGAGTDATVRVWDLDTGKSRTLTGNSSGVSAVAYSPDGHHLAGAGQVVWVWDLDTGKARELTGHTGPVSAVAYSPDDHYLASAGYDATVRVWDLDTGQTRDLTGHSSRVVAVAYSPDGHHLASASYDSTVRVWDLDTGKSRTLTGHTGPVFAVAYSPDGHHLVSGGYDSTVRVWDLDTGKSRTLTGHNGLVSAVAYSRDGHHLASASHDSTVRVWDLDTGEWRMLTGHTGPVFAVAYSPDGRYLASAAPRDGTDTDTTVWDLETGQSRTLTDHTDEVTAMAYSPDGHHLASAGSTVRVWDLDTGKSRALTGNTEPVQAVAYSPDGRYLASASDDATVRMWDLDTGTSRTLTLPTGPVTSIAYSPDGHHLASAGADTTVRVSADTAPTPTVAIDRICRNVDRDLTSQEREKYLPPKDSGARACPRTTG